MTNIMLLVVSCLRHQDFVSLSNPGIVRFITVEELSQLLRSLFDILSRDSLHLGGRRPLPRIELVNVEHRKLVPK